MDGDVLRAMERIMKPYRKWLAISLVTTIGIAIIESSLGYLMKYIVHSGVERQFAAMYGFVAFFIVLILLGCIDKYFIKVATTRFVMMTLQDLRSACVRRISAMQWPELERMTSGDMMSRLQNDMALLQTYGINHFNAVIYMPMMLVCSLGYMAFIHLKLLLVSMMFVPIAFVVTYRMSAQMGKVTTTVQEDYGRTNALTNSVIAGIGIVKAFNLGPLFYEKYKELTQAIIESALKVERKRATLQLISLFLQASPLCIGIVYGAYLIVQGDMSAADLVGFITLLNFAIFPLVVLPSFAGYTREMMAAAERVLTLQTLPIEHAGKDMFPSADGATWDTVAVAFHQVNYGYEAGKLIVQELTFSLPVGRTLALVGPSGSGKSTVLKLLSGFDTSYEGEIKMFGVDVRMHGPQLREKIAVVSQDPYLFPVSLAANIAYGKQGATMQEVIEAAKLAEAHEFIMNLPQQYDTVVGERGATLSGGQKQRLAIARAILKDAPLILLDEPTSALDYSTESLVQRALDHCMEGKSVIVVAHRFRTIQQADEIMVLDQGRVAERGRHEELLQRGGLYAKLYHAAFEMQVDETVETDNGVLEGR